MGQEQGLAGNRALSHVEELAEHSLVGDRAVPEPCLEVDAVFHVVHGAGFGDDGLSLVELDLDDLQVIADELIVDFVRTHGSLPIENAPSRLSVSGRFVNLAKHDGAST